MFDKEDYIEEKYEEYLLRCKCTDETCECMSYEEFADEMMRASEEYRGELEYNEGDFEQCI